MGHYEKIIVFLCFFVVACGSKQPVAYYDTRLPEYNISEMNQAETQSKILGLKTQNYSEKPGSLKIVFGMSNEMGDFIRKGDIQNNYLTYKTNTGFSKHYVLKSNDQLAVEFNAFNGGMKIVDGIDSESYVTLWRKMLNSFQNNQRLNGFKIKANKVVTVSYSGHEQTYSYCEMEMAINNEKLMAYEYRTAYNGSIVRAFASSNLSIANENMQQYAKFMTLKIFLDKGLITVDDYNQLRHEPAKVKSEFILR